MATFLAALHRANKERGFLLCGLNPITERIPRHLRDTHHDPVELLWNFLVPIIDEVAPHVAGYKPNLSFFLRFDKIREANFCGQIALARICQHIRKKYPDHLLILDAKDGDIGASNWGYFERAFDGYDAHALTWNPYLGVACKEQMQTYKDKGVIALARTSNPEGTAFQTKLCEDGRPVFMHNIDQWLMCRNEGFSVGLVAGATHVEELKVIRETVGTLPLLIPGIGKQGGDLHKVCEYGFGGKTGNMMINVSSDILYAGDNAQFPQASASVAKNYAAVINKATSRT